MKIIFDSEEQQNTLLKLIAMECCPSIIDFPDTKDGDCSESDCLKCWKNFGIEMEVRE